MTKKCCVCRKVEQDGDWITDSITSTMEQFTHGYCPACFDDEMENLNRIFNRKNSAGSPVVQGVSNHGIEDVCAF